MRRHSYAQAPDCCALLYLPATLEPATQDSMLGQRWRLYGNDEDGQERLMVE
jgi:hypothetical protein